MVFKKLRFMSLLFLSIAYANAQEISQVKPSSERLITLEQTNEKSFDKKDLFFTISECKTKEKMSCKILESVDFKTLKESLKAMDSGLFYELIVRELHETYFIRDSDPSVKKLKMEIKQLDEKIPREQKKIEQLEEKLQNIFYSVPIPDSYLVGKRNIVITQGEEISKLMTKIESSKDGFFESDLSPPEQAQLKRIIKIVEFVAY